jgi:hypothetical protein
VEKATTPALPYPADCSGFMYETTLFVFGFLAEKTLERLDLFNNPVGY